MQRHPHGNTTKKLPSGNILDYKEVIEFTNGKLFQFAKNLVRDPLEADRIARDTLFKLIERFHGGTVANYKAFMYTTARNACFNYLRSQQQVFKKTKGQPCTANEAEEENRLKELIRREIRVNLITIIEKLPAKLHEVLFLYFIEGLDNTAIAQRTGKTRQTVINQKNDALKLLREIFESCDNLRRFLE
jgi:RNA polymerase sigma factor (sigma-70 family)